MTLPTAPEERQYRERESILLHCFSFLAVHAHVEREETEEREAEEKGEAVKGEDGVGLDGPGQGGGISVAGVEMQGRREEAEKGWNGTE